MAAPMRSTDFRSIVEPILNECFDGVYDQRTDEWSRVFREQEGIPRNYHEEPVLYGFGAAPQLPDGTPVTYQQGGVLFLKRYVYSVYGLAFALTKVLVEDGDRFPGGIDVAPDLLGQVCREDADGVLSALGISVEEALHVFVGGALIVEGQRVDQDLHSRRDQPGMTDGAR